MSLDKQSFFIGIYVGFILTLAGSGYIVWKGFVSKDLLKHERIYIDGKFFKLQEL